VGIDGPDRCEQPREERRASDTSQLAVGREKLRIEEEFYARYRFRMTAENLIRKFAAGPNYNYYRDDRLIQAGGDPMGTLDFYTDHYYDWQSTPISPFVHPASSWGLTKPLVIAEFFPEQTLALPYTALYDTLYANGTPARCRGGGTAVQAVIRRPRCRPTRSC